MVRKMRTRYELQPGYRSNVRVLYECLWLLIIASLLFLALREDSKRFVECLASLVNNNGAFCGLMRWIWAI